MIIIKFENLGEKGKDPMSKLNFSGSFQFQKHIHEQQSPHISIAHDGLEIHKIRIQKSENTGTG